jgi:hypothetical protein
VMMERNCWTLFVVALSHTSKVFVSTCKRISGTLRSLQTLVIKGPNHAIKSGPSHVLPQHAIDKSA